MSLLQKPAPKLPFLVKYFGWIILTLIGCGALVYACLVVTLNRHSIQADFVASQAQGLIAGVYEPLKDNTPPQSMLLDEQEPTSGSYAFSLSDGAERMAFVRSKQVYNASLPYSDITSVYADIFHGWGWKSISVSDGTVAIDLLFEHPQNDRLLAGICRTPDAEFESATTQYMIFVDFDEGSGSEACKDRICSLAQRYCASG